MGVEVNTARRMINNSFALFLSRILTWLFGFALTIFLVRYLGDIDFGKLFFAISFTAILAILPHFGLDTLITREIAKEKGRAKTILFNAVLIQSFLGLFSYLLMIIIVNLLGYPRDTVLAVYIVGLYSILSIFTLSFRSVFQAFEMMEYPAVGNVVEKTVVTLLTIFFLLKGYGLIMVTTVLFFGAVINFLWHLLFLKRILNLDLVIKDFDGLQAKKLLFEAAPFFLVLVFGTIHYRIDAIMLSLMTNDAVVGWYGAAYRLFDALGFIRTILGIVIFPILCKYFVNSLKKFQKYVKKFLNLLIGTAIPISLGTFILSDRIIKLLYGESFAESIPVLQILSIALVFTYVTCILSAVIIVTNNQKKLALTAGFAAVLNPLMNLIAIPRFQHVGAAFTTLITEFFIMCLCFYFLPKGILNFKNFSVTAKALLAGTVMSIFLWILKDLNLIFLILTSFTIYSLFCWLLGVVSNDDVLLVKSAFNSRGG
jgi:O-antigen/teichoic acid export membrane protein